MKHFTHGFRFTFTDEPNAHDMIILTPTYNFPDCIPQPIAIAEGGAVAVDCTINATGLIGELTGVFGATRETHERGIKEK